MWYGFGMRRIACVCVLIALGGCKEEFSFIPGTGTLPDCNEPPITDQLDGTVWFNQGPVTIVTEGCPDVAPEDTLTSCAENWAFSQDGNDISIVVDEYRLNGRLCGDQLSLEGGWWLSVQDEQGACNYEDEDGDEVGIQAGDNVLTVNPAEEQMTGRLVVQGSCDADYEVIFEPVRDSSF
jgi:hypothetical protein